MTEKINHLIGNATDLGDDLSETRLPYIIGGEGWRGISRCSVLSSFTDFGQP